MCASVLEIHLESAPRGALLVLALGAGCAHAQVTGGRRAENTPNPAVAEHVAAATNSAAT